MANDEQGNDESEVERVREIAAELGVDPTTEPLVDRLAAMVATTSPGDLTRRRAEPCRA